MAILSFTSELIEKTKLTHDTYKFVFTIPEEFSFKAGQYVMIKVDNGEKAVWRAYSILSPPTQKNRLDLCIKIISNGFATTVLDKIELPKTFEMKGPIGHFIFDDKSDDQWFICNGTGVVPFYCMIKTYLDRFPNKKFTLLFGVKEKKDLLFHEEFQKIQNPNFTYIPTLSREEWEGNKGRVQKYLPEDLQNKTFYICGLKEMVVDTQNILTEKGVSSENIKFERYS